MSTTTLPDPVVALRTTQRGWAGLSVSARLQPIRRLRRLLASECNSLLAAVAEDIGKPAVEALGGEILPLAGALQFLERNAGRLLRPRRIPRSERPLWLGGQRDTIYRRPRGVVGVIGTWNYPIFLNGVQIVQALAAGNAVLWKPSEAAPASASRFMGLLERAGFPDGLVAGLEPTRENGQLLIESDMDHVVFTGSAEIGRRIATRLGERIISSTLELSGVDAMFVLDDADLNLAGRAAWFGATVNRGQTCIAVRRAFVQRRCYTPFCDALAQLARGRPAVSVVSQSQVTQGQRLVEDALARGARLLTDKDGQQPASTGREWKPAIVADARPEMLLCREASFLPLLAVLPFDTVDEALAQEAQCPYALGASVFSSQPGRANALATRLRAGMVTVNDVVAPTAHPATPFGGRCLSGWGVTQGAEGLLEMTVPQVVSVRTDRFRPHYDLATGGNGLAQENLLRGLLQCSHAAAFGERLRGLGRLLGALRAVVKAGKGDGNGQQ